MKKKIDTLFSGNWNLFLTLKIIHPFFLILDYGFDDEEKNKFKEDLHSV